MVKGYKLKLTNLQQQILRLLFMKNGVVFNQREIAKILKVSSPAVMKAIPFLEKEEMIKIEKDKNSKRISIELNFSNPRVLDMKRIDNLSQVYESGLLDFLRETFAGGTTIIFGSYALGEDFYFRENDERNSDIDIAIIGRKEKKINLEEYEKLLSREIRINFYPSFNKIHKDLKENILGGIVLFGRIEL